MKQSADPARYQVRKPEMENVSTWPHFIAELGFLCPNRRKAVNQTLPRRVRVQFATKVAKSSHGSASEVVMGRMNLSDTHPETSGACAIAARMTALLSALKATHDETVFAELFKYYAPRLKSYMRKLGVAEDLAEELAQEAMASVWRKVHLFDADKAGASTWIYTIARNLRIDAFRRKHRPEIELSDLIFMPDDPPEPDAVLDQRRQAIAVRAALAAIPQEQARIIELSFFEGKPHAEIAIKLDIPLGTVKSRMRLAFQRFRKMLGEFEL